MSQEAYFNSNGELAVPHVSQDDPVGGFAESSSSCILRRKEAYALPLDLPLSGLKMAELNMNLASGDVYSTLLDKFANSGSGVGMSSLIANANLILQNGAFLQSGNAGMDRYLHLPLSPKLFSSDNLSNLARDDPRVSQQNAFADQNSQRGHTMEQLPKVCCSAPVEPKFQDLQFSNNNGMEQDYNTIIQMLKKPRVDLNNDFAQEQIVQQLLLRQDIKLLQDHTPQLKSLIQNQKQQILESIPQFRGVQAQQSEQQFRHHLQQQASCSTSSRADGVRCQQLMQCLHNLKTQAQENSIDFWRKVVSDFYAPCAKERWCLSSYQNIGQQALGILSMGTRGAWCCDLCGSRSGKGFEASSEVLPRLWKIKLESGILEEILFLGFPKDHRLPSGLVLLEYEKAVQESVYEQFRVVHEGKLRVTFRQDLKILSWEFCASHHKEYFLRRLIAPQVNQLICVAQQYQGLLRGAKPEDKVPVEKLQASCDMFAKAGNQFTKNLDLPTVSELGFSKRYVRCLQIAEVLDIMKDLMTFSHDQKLGPIESLHAYPYRGTVRETNGRRSINTQEEETSQGSIQSVITNGNRATGRSVGLDSHFNDTGTTNDRVVCNSRTGDMDLLLVNYYQKVLRESLLNERANAIKPDQSCLTDTTRQRTISSSFLSQQSSNSGLLHSSLLAGLPSTESSEAIKAAQQQMMDKLFQNAIGKQKEQAFCEGGENVFSSLPTGASGTNMLTNRPVLGGCTSSVTRANVYGNIRGNAESSRSISNSDPLSGSNREIEIPEFHLSEALRILHGRISRENA